VEQLPQQIVNGLWQGGALALFALGYTLVFGSLDIVNLAHGALYMWGAYVGLLVVTRLDLPFWAAIPAAMVAACLMAVLLDLLAF
jgi:branched-chain amino acid transport system permease protein